MDKIALVKFLTTPLGLRKTIFLEEVYDNFSEDFWEENQDWIENSKTCNNWIDKCDYNEYYPRYTSKLIERAFKIYKK